MHELKGRQKYKEIIKMQDAKMTGGFEEECTDEGTLKQGFEQQIGQLEKELKLSGQ